MYDADMTTLMTAFPLDESRAREWFAAVRTAYEADPAASVDEFAPRLREESAGIVDSTDVDLFLETLERVGGDRMGLIGRLAELEPELADVHRAMTSPEAVTEEGRFDWVPAEQAEQVAAAWGTDWADLLGEQLDYRWGAGWEANPAEDKAAWLPEVLAELLGGTDAAAPAEEGRFDWVPAEQAERLSSAWGAEWQQPLGEQLDYRWGAGWEANPAEHKTAWLSDLVTELLTPADEPAGTAPEPAGTAEHSAADIRTAVDEVLSEVPGAENLTEAELQQVAADVAAALAGERQPAQ